MGLWIWSRNCLTIQRMALQKLDKIEKNQNSVKELKAIPAKICKKYMEK